MKSVSRPLKSIMFICFFIFTFIHVGTYAQNSIDGVVWLDRNDNGQRESADSFLGAVRVELYSSENEFVTFTFTNTAGYYGFENILDGSYYVVTDFIVGLKAAKVNSLNSDSDINSNLRTEDFTLDSNQSSETKDAGYRSAIILAVPAQLYVCQANEIAVSANVMGNFGQVTYEWNNNPTNNSSINIFTLSNTEEIILTVYDDWNIPISRIILVEVLSELTEKSCIIYDDFDDESSQLNIDVTPSDPGPDIHTDIDFLGMSGVERVIEFTLLEGMAASTFNITEMGMFISNCVDCKTLTNVCYNYSSSSVVDMTEHNYIELQDINVDQGNTQIKFSISDGVETASMVKVLESEGLNTNFDYKFNYEELNNINSVNLQEIVSICFEIETLQRGSDLSTSELSMCSENECLLTVPESIDICIGESAELNAESSCGDSGLLYIWNDVGTGSNQIVSPTTTTTYDLTVYDQRACSKSYSVIVNVSNNPEVEIEGDLTVCEGEESTYSVDHISGLAPYTYEWSIEGETTSELILVINQSSTISVTVTDDNGCSTEETIEVLSLENPELLLTTQPSDCGDSTGSVTPLVTQGESPYLYQWSNGDTSEDLVNVSSGTYGLTVTDNNGCTVESSIFVPNKPCAELGNYVWEDLNYNGLQDVNETPIFGMTVYLKNSNGNIIEETTTSETGFYLFTALEAGDYQVQFEAFGDFVVTKHLEGENIEIDSDVDPVNFMSTTVNLAENEKNYTIDGGFYRPASIGDYVWNDMDDDGFQDPNENGISGLAVKLLDCNNTVIDTTYTDEEGLYLFSDLVPGEYSLDFCDTTGFIFTEQFVGNSDTDSNADEQTGMTECKVVSSGDELEDCDAGLVELAAIGDYVWLDLNGDGLQDPEEDGLEGILLRLHSCDGVIISTTSTDNTGFYEFVDIEPGDYYISVVYPDQYELSPENVGLNDEIDSDFGPNGQTICTTLTPGEEDLSFDLGLFELASLGDYVWWDENLNGIQDEQSSSSLSGFLIKLYDCDSTLLDSTITNENGFYIFNGLLPGDYMIGTELADFMEFTAINEGGDSLDSDIYPESGFSSCLNLESGEEDLSLDIGIVFLSKIGDYVWLDSDGDGMQDSIESGVMDVLISLYTCDGELIETIMSDSIGQWCFEDIPYGEYEIVVDVPDPLSGTLINNGNSQEDSNLNPETNIIECFEINMPIDTSLDFGLVDCSIISGIAWLDAAIDNGILDDVENGINGLKVSIYKLEMDTWTLFGSTDTKHIGVGSGQDGFWEYCIPNGSYYIHFAKLPNYPFVEANQGNNDAVDSEVTHEYGPNTTDLIMMLPGEPQPNINAGYAYNSTLLEREAVIDFAPEKDKINKNSNIKDLKIDIFPNPSLNKVYIEIKHSEHEPKVIQILNSSGSKIQFLSKIRKVENSIYLVEISVDVPGCHFIDLLIGDKKKTVSFIKI